MLIFCVFKMVTYRRMIVKNPEDSSGYMVLKPNGDDFHRVGKYYNKRGLFNLLKGVDSQHKKGEFTAFEFVVDTSGRIFRSDEVTIDTIIELLELKQGVAVEP